MKKIHTLATILGFSTSQQWYEFLISLSAALRDQLKKQYPDLDIEADLSLEAISVKRGKAAWKNFSGSDRISLIKKGSKMGLRIIFASYSREKTGNIQLWFLGKDGCRTGNEDCLSIPRKNLGTDEFIVTVGHWFKELKKPNAVELGGEFI